MASDADGERNSNTSSGSSSTDSVASTLRSVLDCTTFHTGRSRRNQCEACRMSGSVCTDKCLMKIYFPRDEPNIRDTLKHIWDTFGFVRVNKMLSQLHRHDQRELNAASIAFEARVRAQHPIDGCSGLVKALQLENDSLKKAITHLEQQISKLHINNMEVSGTEVEGSGGRETVTEALSTSICAINVCAQPSRISSLPYCAVHGRQPIGVAGRRSQPTRAIDIAGRRSERQPVGVSDSMGHLMFR